METSPCLGCKLRHDLCHSKCPKYLEYKDKYWKEKTEHLEEKRREGFIESLHIHRAKTGKRRKA